MHVFSRLTGFILFVLSLSLFAHAIPAPGTPGALTTRDAKCDQLVGVVVDLKTKIDACIAVMVKAEAAVHVVPQLEAVVGHIQATAEAVLAVGAIHDMDTIVKADVAAKVAAIIAVILKACLRLSIKFGIQIFLELFVKIDAVLKLLLINLGVCVDEIVVLIGQFVLATCAHILVTLNFKLCLDVLAIVNLGIN
ncbi:unnamed protein product [Rhizoctonia solani]|uniref:Transmembrane protein n=3 Tax=Rhizoctonia solani TaxID=456999 RepID=A0A8H3GPU7_9AGAM|nr:transmembrane protein, putative [Rhizoctonia solani AG-3 Rhs1AP]KEP47098.1 putative transmembrane protein [Rhizoctonia solani 123E]CAE6460435.1 unnamed protein product [Rhizoctonia solani]CAE6462078.1 unnamed protein product [Rhizoctonia solani]